MKKLKNLIKLIPRKVKRKISIYDVVDYSCPNCGTDVGRHHFSECWMCYQKLR